MFKQIAFVLTLGYLICFIGHVFSSVHRHRHRYHENEHNVTEFNHGRHRHHHRHHHHHHHGEKNTTNIKSLRRSKGRTKFLRSNGKKTRPVSTNKVACSRDIFVGCLNSGDLFEISEVITGTGIADLMSPDKSQELLNDKKGLLSKLSTICAATDPVVRCLSRTTCMDGSFSNQDKVLKSLFRGIYANQARLIKAWVRCQFLTAKPRDKAAVQEKDKSKPNYMTYYFKSLDRCPRLTSALFKEECGGVATNSDVKINAVLQDPWDTPSSFLSAVTLQWIDFTFLELLKADDITGQVNISALPSIEEEMCVYLSRKIDCFTVQVYRYCEKAIQDAIIENLMKFINFQLLVSDSDCDTFSEDPVDMRRVLEINTNTNDLRSLSFIDAEEDPFAEGTHTDEQGNEDVSTNNPSSTENIVDDGSEFSLVLSASPAAIFTTQPFCCNNLLLLIVLSLFSSTLIIEFVT